MGAVPIYVPLFYSLPLLPVFNAVAVIALIFFLFYIARNDMHEGQGKYGK